MTEPQELVHVASQTITKLQELWNEIGLDVQDRKAQLIQLTQDVSRVYNSKLVSTEEYKELLKERNAFCVECIQRVRTQLGDTPESETLNGMPLCTRFSKLSQQLLVTLKRRDDRVRQLLTLQEKLQTIWQELGLYPPQKAAKEFGGEIFTAKFQLVFEPPSNTLNNSNNSNGGISQEDYDTIAAAARSAVFGIMPKQSRQDLSINVVKIFEDQLKLAETEKSQRTARVQGLCEQIVDLWSELCIPVDTNNGLHSSILNGNFNGLLKMDTISQLECQVRDLIQEKQNREEQIKQHAISITELWDKLHISQEERDNWLTQNTTGDLGPQALAACVSELNRLHDIRAGRMKELILACRKTLHSLWDSLHYGPQERTHFEPAFNDEVFNEDVLEEHEKEIIRLESLLCSMAPILKLIERRNGILAEKEEFEQSSKDPNRLLTKKSSRDPGRLLREEKMRKTIEKELPKLQEKLKDLITEWEDANNEYFIYNGSRYLQSLLQLEQTSQHQDSSLKVGKSTMPTPKKAALVIPATPPKRSVLNATCGGTPSRTASTPKASSGLNVTTTFSSTPKTPGDFTATPVRANKRDVRAILSPVNINQSLEIAERQPKKAMLVDKSKNNGIPAASITGIENH